MALYCILYFQANTYFCLLIIKVWGTSSLGFTDENMDRKRMLRMKNQSIAKPNKSKTEYLVNWVMTLNNIFFSFSYFLKKFCIKNGNSI